MALPGTAVGDAPGDRQAATTPAAETVGAAPDVPGPVALPSPTDPARAQRDAAGPAQQPADARATPAGPDLPATVPVHHPDVLVSDVPAGGVRQTASGVGGVVYAVGAARFEAVALRRPDAGDGHRLRILAVNPRQFRRLTPRVTAETPGVFRRLVEGGVAVRHDIAHQLDLELGGALTLAGPGGARQQVRIGAFASNGAPPLADAVISWDVARRLGVDRANTVIAAVDDSAAASSVGGRLERALGGGSAEVREIPSSQQARLAGRARAHIEPFSYRDRGDGTIAIDSAWVGRYITTVDLPHLGTTRCHRAMVPQLLAALQEIEARGLAHELKPEEFAGCWVPRHIDWDPADPLSMHAWGLAVDINAQSNPLGAQPQMNRRVVAIFRKWGFEWGGTWSRPDGMHFQLEQIVRP